MDVTKGYGWEEQEIGKCSICGGWVVVYPHVAPAAGSLRDPWCVACGAVLYRNSVLPMAEKRDEGPWVHIERSNGIEDPALRRAYCVGLREGWKSGALFRQVPDSILALPEEV